MTEPYLSVDRLTMTYDQGGKKRTALQDVSFSVQKGEFLAIVGQSGAGKTTLLRLLCGLELASQGSILVANENLHSLNEAARTKFRQAKVGFAFQLFDLMEHITVAENVALPLILAGVSKKNALVEAYEMLERLGVKELHNAYPDDISGGEMQRIALARALIHKPELLLADEPTGSLASLDAENVLDLLNSLRKNSLLTIVMVTHNTRAAAHADRVLRLKKGRLVTEKKGTLYA